MKKIAVDFQSTQGRKTGIGTFTQSLFDAIGRMDCGFEFVFLRSKKNTDLNAPQRLFWENIEIPRQLRQAKADLVFCPGFSPPVNSPCPRVVTVHDIIGKIHPRNQLGFSRFYWSLWQPYAIRKAETIVASSESTRRDLERYLGVMTKSVEVVPLAANPLFRKIDGPSGQNGVLEKYGIRAPFIISVGTFEPRKNTLMLLKAFERAAGMGDATLVLVGKDGGMEPALRLFIREMKLSERVRILGYVPDQDLVSLYNAALGYAMVSLYEGFGLPVLEAMSCGLTGVVSDVSSLPEVAGDTAWRVDPQDIKSVQGALETFVSDPAARRQLSVKAYERSKLFSYEKTAKKMIEVFEKAAQ